MNQSLFLPGEKVLIACSGGKDSVYLLERLFREQERLGITLAVAHVDHGLRPESAQDARFVRELAAKRGLPYFEKQLLLSTRRAPEGVEALARRRRYEALEEIALAEGFTAVATAHHRDDQVETVLLRVLQGARPRHWLGMEPSRPIHQRSSVRLVRPLLETGREEVEIWLKAEGLTWREDSSNRNIRFLRNLLRSWLAALNRETRLELEQEVLFLRERAIALTQIEQRLQQALLLPRLRQWETSLWLDLRGLPALPEWFLHPLVENLLRRLDGLCPPGTLDAVCNLWREGRPGSIALDPAGIEIRRGKDSLEFLATVLAE